jgi:ribonuclease HII
MPDRLLELELGGIVCGVDEAGRGPLAGPVVAAAVILPAELPAELAGLNDSKKLTRKARERLFPLIQQHCHWAIAEASVAEIDSLNIHRATLTAMARAVAALPVSPAHALIDGKFAPPVAAKTHTVIGGDAICVNISAASILAKVARDQIMGDLAALHPGYGWERNAGYGTAEHMAALEQNGTTIHHRRSFAPVAAALAAITGDSAINLA